MCATYIGCSGGWTPCGRECLALSVFRRSTVSSVSSMACAKTDRLGCRMARMQMWACAQALRVWHDRMSVAAAARVRIVEAMACYDSSLVRAAFRCWRLHWVAWLDEQRVLSCYDSSLARAAFLGWRLHWLSWLRGQRALACYDSSLVRAAFQCWMSHRATCLDRQQAVVRKAMLWMFCGRALGHWQSFVRERKWGRLSPTRRQRHQKSSVSETARHLRVHRKQQTPVLPAVLRQQQQKQQQQQKPPQQQQQQQTQQQQQQRPPPPPPPRQVQQDERQQQPQQPQPQLQQQRQQWVQRASAPAHRRPPIWHRPASSASRVVPVALSPAAGYQLGAEKRQELAVLRAHMPVEAASRALGSAELFSPPEAEAPAWPLEAPGSSAGGAGGAAVVDMHSESRNLSKASKALKAAGLLDAGVGPQAEGSSILDAAMCTSAERRAILAAARSAVGRHQAAGLGSQPSAVAAAARPLPAPVYTAAAGAAVLTPPTPPSRLAAMNGDNAAAESLPVTPVREPHHPAAVTERGMVVGDQRIDDQRIIKRARSGYKAAASRGPPQSYRVLAASRADAFLSARARALRTARAFAPREEEEEEEQEEDELASSSVWRGARGSFLPTGSTASRKPRLPRGAWH